MPRTALTYSHASASCPTRIGRSAEAVVLATAASGAAANVAVANIAAGRTGGKGGAGIPPPIS